MNNADRLTASRLFLAPVFFALFMWGEPLHLPGAVVAALLILLFTVIEVSDLLDGMVARGSGTVSSFGKLFDPFADVFARITYFVCFAWVGIMPLWIFLIVLYREFGILFIRMLLAERGIAMGARPGGKAKAVVYMTVGALSLLYWSLSRFGIVAGSADPWLRGIILAFYLAAAVLSIASFIDYWIQFRKQFASSASR
ncbi:MAG TPA: CDP-alcohol phosphatidyltransferase family protein [Rectinemataceae bacterium]|nr:CDP-alcohol phosphatidyltransferase family protein [Rectinemataceae bacterium]